ncbi:hypothetical protein C8R44DRAFT_910695 [Mycena epipterygia]|nr:hypothetical protein C8R44DRAFT_910695 [Mycena epipterygia]
MAYNYYQYPAAAPPQNMTGLSSNTAYLLGMGPLPHAPTGRQLAVAQMQAALNSGMFDGTHGPTPRFEEDQDEDDDDEERNIDPALRAISTQVPGPTPTVGTYPSGRAAVRTVTITATVYGHKTNDKKAAAVTTTLIIPVDIPPDDFFSRLHAVMNVDPATASLGWKESAERRRDPYHRLSSAEDLKDAFKQLIMLQDTSRRRKPFVMEIVNTEVQPDGKTVKQAEKPSETAITVPELRKVQAKLACAEHPGRNRWCYVMGPTSKHPGKHVPLGIDVVSLWARKMHDGEADEDCIIPPNILNLDELAERGCAREERNARGRGQAALPPIHVHVGGSAERTLRDVDTNIPTSRKHAREESSDDESDDDIDALKIEDVLQELHQRYPALNYLQYAEALKAKGIIYANSALDFDNLYYKDNVGMADGAIGNFVKRARKMVKDAKKRNGKKRAKTSEDNDKEN